MTTIRLTTFTSLQESEKDIIYLLTSVDTKEKEAIFKAHREKEDYKIQVNDNLFVSISNIVSFGTTNNAKPSSISSYVGYLLGPKQEGDRERHYRDYSMAEEKQDNTKHYINICSDRAASARSAFKSLKEEYCFLWILKCKPENFYEICNIYNI